MTKPRKRNKASAALRDRLRAMRKRLDLTQTEAAEKVGVSRRSWAAWEGGEQVPSPPLQILIDLLDQGKI